jgi:hypothetical protein
MSIARGEPKCPIGDTSSAISHSSQRSVSSPRSSPVRCRNLPPLSVGVRSARTYLRNVRRRSSASGANRSRRGGSSIGCGPPGCSRLGIGIGGGGSVIGGGNDGSGGGTDGVPGGGVGCGPCASCFIPEQHLSAADYQTGKSAPHAPGPAGRESSTRDPYLTTPRGNPPDIIHGVFCLTDPMGVRIATGALPE